LLPTLGGTIFDEAFAMVLAVAKEKAVVGNWVLISLEKKVHPPCCRLYFSSSLIY